MSTSTLSRPRTRHDGALVVVGPAPASAGLGGPLGPPVGLGPAAVRPAWGPGRRPRPRRPGAPRPAAAPDTPTFDRPPERPTARRRRAAGSAGRRGGGQGRRALRGRLWGGVDLRARRAPLVRPAQRGPRQGTRARCCACSTPPSGRPAAQAARLHAELIPSTQLLRVRPHELVGEELDADLLVVGGPRTEHGATERRGSVQPGGMGLVAHSALHHAPCPVLLAPR